MLARHIDIQGKDGHGAHPAAVPATNLIKEMVQEPLDSPQSSKSACGSPPLAHSPLAKEGRTATGSLMEQRSDGWGRAVEAGAQGDEALPGTTVCAGAGTRDEETAAQHSRQGSSSSLGSSGGPNRRMPVASDGSGRRLCYDFTHGRCMRGDHCRFAHLAV